MKKASIFLFALFFGMAFHSIAQDAPKDFFAGKWNIVVSGTPEGESKIIAHLVRKDGSLTGELAVANDATKPAIEITHIDESENAIEIEFSTSGYDVTLTLEKVDNNNLKGQMMGMFDAKAVRVKE